MSIVRSLFQRLRGRSQDTITIPVLDGPLMPNRALDTDATLLYRASDVDNLTRDGGRLLLSAGRDLCCLDPASARVNPVASFASDIAALAAHDGVLAIGLSGGGVLIQGGGYDATAVHDLADWGIPLPLSCVTALCWLDADQLIVVNGSGKHTVNAWRRDLLERGARGHVVLLNLATHTARVLGEHMAWPSGVALAADGDLFVSEAWRHRIVRLSVHGKPEYHVVQDDLPAYPGRISAAPAGGYCLSCFAIRNQLVEFILSERAYCQRMLAEVPEPYWMAPALASGLSFKEPMQRNQLRQMGVMKPWAPTRSYGLVVRCDAQMRPLASFHSRADGAMHGVTSACDLDGDLFVCARGAGAIVRLPGVAQSGARP